MRPGRAADHSPPSSAAVMEEYSYNCPHHLGHNGPVTGSLYFTTRKQIGNNFTCVTCSVKSSIIKQQYYSQSGCSYRLVQAIIARIFRDQHGKQQINSGCKIGTFQALGSCDRAS